MTTTVPTMVLAKGRQLRGLGQNAVIFELERRMDGATYRALDPDGVSILTLRVLLDRIGADPTEPIVRGAGPRRRRRAGAGHHRSFRRAVA